MPDEILSDATLAKAQVQRGVWKWILIGGLGLIAIVGLLLPSLCRAREPANRIKCSSNLRQIGLALRMYIEAGKDWPDHFPRLLTHVDLTPDVVICPSSNADRSDAKTVEGLVVDFEEPGKHLSYVYVADGLTADENRGNVVVAYDRFDNHDHDGINVLFADGHTDWLETGTPEKLNAIGSALVQQTRDRVRPVLLHAK